VSTSQLRLAFIGCGHHATNLLREMPFIPQIDLVAVCDTQAELARSAARRFGALSWYADFQKMLDAERPDAVAVIGPPPMGIEIGSTVLDAGFHLYIEKPVGRNSREAGPLVEAARRSAKYTQVGFNQRHAPAMQVARGLVAAPEFGQPTYIESRHWEPTRLVEIWGITDLLYAWLMLHGIHAVDTLRDVFGEVVEVFSRMSVAGEAGSLTSLCAFENGASGLLNLHSNGAASEQTFEAVGSLGRVVRVDEFAEVQYSDSSHWAPGLPGRQGKFLRRTFDATVGDRKGYRTELESFARCILTGASPYPSVADGFASTRLAEAVFASARIGQPVRVADAPVLEW
jgi:predicted dehydrogenase